MGSPLFGLSGTPGPGRDLRSLRFLLATSPDDFFLERARRALEEEFLRAFPGGEVTILDPAPTPFALFQELQAPSLFAQQRLILLPHAETLLAADSEQFQGFAEPPSLSPGEALWVGVFAERAEPPRAPFVDAISSWAEVTHFPLPPPPKPWEGVRLSREQREFLASLLLQEIPELRAHQDVVDVLLEIHGSSPRLLLQAARSLVASQDLSPEAVRQSSAREQVPAAAVEQALQAGQWPVLAGILGKLAVGAWLEGFRGELGFGRRAADVMASLLARACFQALTLRILAERAGFGAELSPAQVAQPWWYPKVFKAKIFPALLVAAESMPELKLAERSPWALQASFRVAAHFSAERLLQVLVMLLESGAFRSETGDPWAPVTLAYASLFAASRSW